MTAEQNRITMEVVNDPEELEKARPQWDRYDRNFAWFKAHAAEAYDRYRGKFVCIAGEELFAADSVKEARALATKAHPEDDGAFVLYIPRENIPRILC